MTLKEKKNAIKRINERRKEIEKRFGYDSYPARHYREKMDILAGGNLLPSGNISHGTAAVEAMTEKDIEAMLRQETAGEIADKGRKHIEKETGKSAKEISVDEIADFYKKVKPVQEMLEDLGPDMSDALYKWRKENGYLKGSGKGRMTYDQIAEACNQWKNLSEDEQNPFKPQNREKARQEMAEVFPPTDAEARTASTTSKIRIQSGRGSGSTFKTSGVSDSV